MDQKITVHKIMWRKLHSDEDLAIHNSTMPTLIETHSACIERFRATMNLIGPGPVSFHIQDAEKALHGLDAKGYWADFGTGAGFPGLVFAHLYPAVQLDLVDSRQKRCWFLNHVLQQAERNPADGKLAVHCTRIEQLRGGPYDGVTARALAPPDKVMDYAKPHLKIGGRLVLLLQETQTLSVSPGYVMDWERSYTISGKQRKTSVLRRVDE
jgi:16S rRNA G527 N7-methylase RsmG